MSFYVSACELQRHDVIFLSWTVGNVRFLAFQTFRWWELEKWHAKAVRFHAVIGFWTEYIEHNGYIDYPVFTCITSYMYLLFCKYNQLHRNGFFILSAFGTWQTLIMCKMFAVTCLGKKASQERICLKWLSIRYKKVPRRNTWVGTENLGLVLKYL